MELIKIDYEKPGLEDINKIVNVLEKGGVVLAPSDTCYGFLCDIQNEEAVEKIYKIKNRSLKIPVSIAVDFSIIDEYICVSEEQQEMITDYLPGLYTLVLQKSDLVPSFITNNTDFVGVRVMKCHFMNLLLSNFKHALVTTSANKSGTGPKYDIKDILGEVDNSLIDLVIDGGKLKATSPSKVIKFNEDGEQEIIRW